MPSFLISKSKLYHNLHAIRNSVSCEVACVIKDNAYGHGIDEISDLLVDFGIKSVFVKNNIEAHKVKSKFDCVTILYPTSFNYISSNVHFSVSSLDCLNEIDSNCSIELKINTGMNRNGIDLCDLPHALTKIKSMGTKLFGVFTHNGYGDYGGDCVSYEFLRQQDLFREAKDMVSDFISHNNLSVPRFHSLSSSGSLKVDNIDDDLVRIGIAMYGYIGIQCNLNLQPIGELWANKVSTRKLKAGSRIGYDGSYRLHDDCIVSSYDIGYGDGLLRLNENHSSMFTKEGFLVLPRMSMDSTSIISDSDRVCIMYDANSLAKIFGTIPYEILCRISPFIKREVVD